FQRARAAGQEGLAIARRLEDRLSEAAAFATMGLASAFGHDFDRAIDDCRNAIRIATEIDAKGVIASAYVATALVHAVTAHLEESAAESEKAVSISEAANDVPSLVMATSFSGHLLNWQGNYHEAWRRQEIAVARAREHRAMFPLFWSLW